MAEKDQMLVDGGRGEANPVARLNILAMAPNAWNGPWMNRQQLLSRLGAIHDILYTNGLWAVWDRYRPEWRTAPVAGDFLRQDQVVVDASPKFLLRWPRYSWIDDIAMGMAASRWMRAFRGNRDIPRIAYLFHPQYFPYLEKLKPDFVVYHAYDMFSLTPEWNEELNNYQHKLLEISDLVVASSDAISDELRSTSGKPVETLPNGADYDLFLRASESSASEPDDLKNIPYPRIGYVGNLNLKVDFPLVASVARRKQCWNFVFVGGKGTLDADTEKGFEACSALRNVHFLGPKDYREIPAYAANMDVNLMCYRVDDGVWTRGIYPLKLHEYLATGKPVISSNIPSVLPFESVVAIARSHDQWPGLIEAALQGNGAGSADKRRSVAKENSWSTRAARLNDCLMDMVAGLKNAN